MGRAFLPEGWQIVWAREATREAGLTLAVEAVAPNHSSVSMALWERGLGAWGRDDAPETLGAIEVHLPVVPVLDEIWCLYMLAARARGEPRASSWEAMSHYVEDVRRGFWPDRVAPEHAVQAVYSAIVHEHLAGSSPDRDAFLAAAFELCRHVDGRLAAGADLLTTDVTGAPKLQRYRAALASDHKLYKEDLTRGVRMRARIPAARADGRERRVGLLVLRAPVARQFKMWARSDPDAPGGHGYPLLLTDLGAGEIVLSADPTARVQLGWLAAGLDKLEQGEKRWYDGARHGHTLVAAPKGGTRLTLDQVLAYLRGELALRRIWSKRAVRAAGVSAASAATVGVLVLVAGMVAPRNHAQDVAEANRDAVYLVRLPGNEVCTAFAVGERLLATARHCVVPGHTEVIRNGTPSDQRRVVRSRVHPNADVDVGLLEVNDPLPSRVQLGSRADLDRAQGMTVFVYGFPTKGLDLNRPVARFQKTDFNKPAEYHRVEHSGLTAGGSSGGPIFNEAGRVIAIHSGAHADEWGAASNFPVAVPIDRLNELVTGAHAAVAPKAQP